MKLIVLSMFLLSCGSNTSPCPDAGTSVTPPAMASPSPTPTPTVRTTPAPTWPKTIGNVVPDMTVVPDMSLSCDNDDHKVCDADDGTDDDDDCDCAKSSEHGLGKGHCQGKHRIHKKNAFGHCRFFCEGDE